MTIQCQRCYQRLDITPMACLYCKHWRPLKPGENYYNQDHPGAIGKCCHPTPSPRMGTLQIAIATDRCELFEERPIAQPTCQTCAFWTRYTTTTLGRCANLKFVYNAQGDPVPADGLGYGDFDGYGASLMTGEAFGCIHHQPRT